MQRNIILSVEHRSDKINIWADPSMLEKIIFNLLSNAFKATKDYGAVTLKVQETSEPIEFPLIKNSKRNIGVIVSISDSGIGIKEENLKKIFSRFLLYPCNHLFLITFCFLLCTVTGSSSYSFKNCWCQRRSRGFSSFFIFHSFS